MPYPVDVDAIVQYAGPMVMFTGAPLPNIAVNLVYDIHGGPVVIPDLSDPSYTGPPPVAYCSVAVKGSTKSVTQPIATILDSNNGIVQLNWNGFTFGAPGLYEAQVVVVALNNTFIVTSQRFLIRVENSVGGILDLIS